MKEKPIKAKLWKDIHTIEELIPKLRDYLNLILILEAFCILAIGIVSTW